MPWQASSVFKLCLSESERLLLQLFPSDSKDTSAAKGAFGLVANLGSIVCRVVFAPLEDCAFAIAAQSKEESDAANEVAGVAEIQFTLAALGAAFGPGEDNVESAHEKNTIHVVIFHRVNDFSYKCAKKSTIDNVYISLQLAVRNCLLQSYAHGA